MSFRISALWLSVLIVVPNWCGATVAVCTDPSGRLLGIPGGTAGKDRIDVADGMRGRRFTFVWQTGATTATVVSQGPRPAEPETEQARIVFETRDQVSFLVTLDSSVWLYSVYPVLRRFVLTSHNDGIAGFNGGAVAKVFDGPCDVRQ